jgi:hypothetical protein
VGAFIYRNVIRYRPELRIASVWGSLNRVCEIYGYHGVRVVLLKETDVSEVGTASIIRAVNKVIQYPDDGDSTHL